MIKLPKVNENRILGQSKTELIYNDKNWSIYYEKTYELKKSGSRLEVDVDITIVSVAFEYAKNKWYYIQEISFDFYSFIYNEIKQDVLINNFDMDDFISNNEDSNLIHEYLFNLNEKS